MPVRFMPVLHPVKSILLLGHAVLVAVIMAEPVSAADLVLKRERAAPSMIGPDSM